jgi:hypothetical protein
VPTAVQVFSISSANLEVTVSYDGHRLSAKLIGQVDGPEGRQGFATTIDRLHREARLLHVAEVVIDLRELSFLDTTSLRRLISLIADIRSLGPDGEYRVRLVGSGRPWQERTLPMLRALAVGLVTVEGLPT